MLDGCPFISRDGKRFYMASNRPGGLGGIDIWVSTPGERRRSVGAPVNVGAPVKSAANDFCTTIARDGHLFYFVSNRTGGCGGDDIYTTRLPPNGWDPAATLGCDVNSAAHEASPMPLPERSEGPCSTSRAIAWAASPPRTRVRSRAAAETRPSLSWDGTTPYFGSTRPGGEGSSDHYVTTRTKPNGS